MASSTPKEEDSHKSTSKSTSILSKSTEESNKNIDKKKLYQLEVEGSERPVLARKHNKVVKLLLGGQVKPVPHERSPHPKSLKNICSYATWAWVSPTLKTGFDRILEINDIFLISDQDKIERRVQVFKDRLESYKQDDVKRPYAEFFATVYTLRWLYIANLVTGSLFVAGSIGMSLMSRTLINLIDDIYLGITSHHGHAAGFAVGTTLVQLGFQFFLLWQNYINRITGEFTRTMLISAVYDKLVKLSPTGRQLYPASKVTSLVTTDTNRIFMAVRWSSMIILFFPAFGAMIGVLVYNIGAPALAGCGLVALGIVLNVFLSRQITKLRKKSLPFADKRIGIIRETVEQMRVIKFYGWESSFVKLLSKARHKETVFLRILGLIEGLVDATLTSIPQFGGVLSFAVRIITHHSLEAATAFSSLTLFQLLVPFSMMFSNGITSHADAWISVKRLNEFFNAPEEGNYVKDTDKGRVFIENGTFDWDLINKATAATTNTATPDDTEKSALEPATLSNISLEILPGKMVMIVGSIGTGKSSLLNAIIGTIPKTEGEVYVGGSVSSVLSTWSQNASIRENVLFGRPYDQDKYRKTLFACCLEPDLKNIAGGDLAEVGERGITLSGGQKARIALARCVYADGDIIILDDILSAVDGAVASHIMKYCINGLLKTKTRILTTHNFKILSSADSIVYMHGNGDISTGSLNELLATNPGFRNLHDKSGLHEKESDVSSATESVELDPPQQEMQVIDEILDTEDTQSETKTENEVAVEKIVKEEQRFAGTVSRKVLMNYINSGSKLGIGLVIIILLIQACVATSQVMQSIVLQFWTSNKYHTSQGMYIGMYCLVVALRAVFFVLMVFTVSFFCYSSASVLHNGAIETIYKAPMAYFDTTPLGRIINRFTDDTANLDTQMLMLLRMALFSLSTLLASIVAIFVYVPWAILTILPIILIGFVLLNYYRASARELKRINSVFRSGMFSVMTETIGGLSVILGYKQQSRFANLLHSKIDDMNVSFEINLASQLWLSLRISTAMLMVTLIVVLLSVFQVFNLNASKVGVLLSLLPSISISTVNILPIITDLENQMNSVERLYELKYDIPQEAPYHMPDNPVPENWPTKGRVEYQNLTIKYREELAPVLKNVSFSVRGGEKIGICGRTGAGKSTILAALFRLCEADNGSIFIDGIDISKIGLSDLRNSIGIIPQEPVLFEGTIRSNLDPFNNHQENELQDALRRSGVTSKEYSNQKFQLDAKVDAGGSNLSLGERQLLTLARALVRNAKILVLDEATAAVDAETDASIQETIRKEFQNCTVLCIAHRLQTIVNYDKVLVMSHGEVLEFDEPITLFKQDSEFAKMCSESGITLSDFN